uniref:uncharacterized protein LOC122590704 n=1 Tax=Erigeron canadensis TaxID=72917 RepID=UPI001CB8FB47|nr:uncharacterized protein LOC122590704 [Erigeron canadensis]
MIFIPICRGQHFYLLVLEITDDLNGFHIIDNITSTSDFKDKYENVCDTVLYHFSRHFKNVNPLLSNILDLYQAEQLDLQWHTENNNIDCGVFLMRHMECFIGQPSKNWNCGIPVESKDQLEVLVKLRIKYAIKMLTHDINTEATKILEDANEYKSMYSIKEMKENYLRTRDYRVRRAY